MMKTNFKHDKECDGKTDQVVAPEGQPVFQPMHHSLLHLQPMGDCAAVVCISASPQAERDINNILSYYCIIVHDPPSALHTKHTNHGEKGTDLRVGRRRSTSDELTWRQQVEIIGTIRRGGRRGAGIALLLHPD